MTSINKVLTFYILLSSMPAFSFVLLSKKKATLPATPLAPEISFVWDGKAPSLDSKEKFQEGRFANASNEELMLEVLKDALSRWSTVRGSYLKLVLVSDRKSLAQLNSEDKINSIVTQSNDNLSVAAFAKPEIPDNHIEDCDISIADKSVSVTSLAYTITHEIGHCVGLGHPHTNYAALMGYSRPSGQSWGLAPDDKAGVIYLYPDPAVYDGSVKENYGCASIGAYVPTQNNQKVLFTLICFSAPLVMYGLRLARLRKRDKAQSHPGK